MATFTAPEVPHLDPSRPRAPSKEQRIAENLCFACGVAGHRAAACPEWRNRCFRCRGCGHKGTECPAVPERRSPSPVHLVNTLTTRSVSPSLSFAAAVSASPAPRDRDIEDLRAAVGALAEQVRALTDVTSHASRGGRLPARHTDAITASPCRDITGIFALSASEHRATRETILAPHRVRDVACQPDAASPSLSLQVVPAAVAVQAHRAEIREPMHDASTATEPSNQARGECKSIDAEPRMRDKALQADTLSLAKTLNRDLRVSAHASAPTAPRDSELDSLDGSSDDDAASRRIEEEEAGARRRALMSHVELCFRHQGSTLLCHHDALVKMVQSAVAEFKEKTLPCAPPAPQLDERRSRVNLSLELFSTFSVPSSDTHFVASPMAATRDAACQPDEKKT